METKIVLAVSGVSLDNDDHLEAIGEHLGHLGWVSLGGLVQAVLYTDAPFPVGVAVSEAQKIRTLFRDATVRVDEELVALSDIAVRLSVTRETVRLWSLGKRRAGAGSFPTPRARVSAEGTAMFAWAWADVVGWLRRIELDPEPDVGFLSDREVAELQHLLATRARSAKRWLPVGEAAGVFLGQVGATLADEAEYATSQRFALQR